MCADAYIYICLYIYIYIYIYIYTAYTHCRAAAQLGRGMDSSLAAKLAAVHQASRVLKKINGEIYVHVRDIKGITVSMYMIPFLN